MDDAAPAPGSQPEMAFLSGGGEMGRRMRAFNWAASPLGRAEAWPQSLRSAVSICLGSTFPIAIYWGPAFVLLYNDAWSPIPADKHPNALGKPAREVWPEIWDELCPMFEGVVRTGEAARAEDQMLPMRRRGFVEECYFNYGLSPIRGEDGTVGGLFNTVVETTLRVVGERRARTMRKLSERVALAPSTEEVCRTAGSVLAEAGKDLPFCLLYLLGPVDGRRTARLAAAAGLAPGAGVLGTVDVDDAGAAFPLAEAIDGGKAVTIECLDPTLRAALAPGPWPEPTTRAAIVPIVGAERETCGALVCGLSPRLPFDDPYEVFVERAAAQIAGAVVRVRALEEERRRAEALAEIDRAKTVFFANVSHEFRTPLTLMLGPLEDLAASVALPAEVRENVAVAQRNGQRLLKLVNALLDFAHIEAGRANAIFRPTDMSLVTAELASNFHSACVKAGLALKVDCPTLPRSVYLDTDMWEKIVLNLVSNAFKFTLEGGIEVTTSTGDDGAAARLTVRDTGVGVPAAELPLLFERFHRVEAAGARSQEGSGIGLSLVRELVRLHGGAIEAASEAGCGSVFTVSVPFGKGHLPANRVIEDRPRAFAAHGGAYVEEALGWLPGASAFDADLPAQDAHSGGDPGRVLLADDNADMRGYVTRLLRRQGYAVEAVADGGAALVGARARRPDLLVADVMMPGMDGMALLRAMRGDEGLRDVPVILLSARAGEAAKVEGLEAGADDYLVKPFSAREFTARVKATIDLARLRQEARARQQLLLQELDHRVKNTLAIVQSLANQTLHLTPADRFAEVLGARLGALARAHDLLTRQNWEHTDLGEIVGTTLDPYASVAGRVAFFGPAVTLAPGLAISFHLTFHELATNAAKYGALSVEGGRVDVRWRIDDGAAPSLRLEWWEIDGPAVRPPSRKGFGTKLIARGLAHETGGEVDLAFEPAGLRCTIVVPLSNRVRAEAA